MGQLTRNGLVSAFTSAGAFIVSTTSMALVGVMCSGSANNTTINVFQGTTTGGTQKAIFPITATTGNFAALPIPIVCSGGICATNVGTVASYAIVFTEL